MDIDLLAPYGRAEPRAPQVRGIATIRQILTGDHPTLPLGGTLRSYLKAHDGPTYVDHMNCHKCSTTQPVVWGMAVRQNGVQLCVARCLGCGWQLRQIGIKRSPCDVSMLIPMGDNRSDASPCERCGVEGVGVELHHWAPAHLFDDSWAWPTSWLCRECHMLWHSVVTPTMHLKKSA